MVFLSNYTFDSDSLKYFLNKLKELFTLSSEADLKVDQVNGKDLVTNDYTDEYAQLNNKIINDITISDKTDTEITLTFSRKNGDSSSIRIPYDKHKKSALFVDAPEKFLCLADEENKINYRYISSLKDGNHRLVVEIVKSTGANVNYQESYTYDEIPDYYLYIPGEEDIALRMYFIDSENTMTGITYLEPEIACLVAEYVLNEINDNAYPNLNNGSFTNFIANDTQNDDNTFARTILVGKEGPTKIDFRNTTGLTKINKIGPTVTNMSSAFHNCYNLTGSPVCGPNVTDMTSTYMNCHNLTGQPVCGPKVTTMYCAYYNCNNLYGDMYAYSDNITNTFHCFYGRNTSNQLNIVVNFGTESYNSFTTHRITGYSLNWTNAGNGSIYCWNDEFNIVIFNMQTTSMYNVFNNNKTITKAACGPNVTNMSNAYYKCSNIKGSPACGNNVTNMSHAYYNCYNLSSNPACGPNVTNMYNAYRTCRKLTGDPACGDNVIDMANAYCECNMLNGIAACGSNVVNMFNAYYNCFNVRGVPVCGDKVTNFANTYVRCYNLTGNPVCGNNVTNMWGTYIYCNRITGPAVCGPNVRSMYMAYYACSNITEAVCGPNVTNMQYTFAYCPIKTAVCGDKVTDMFGTYQYCGGMKCSPVCGPNVTDMAYTYEECRNLIGSPVCGDLVTDMRNTYRNCINLTGSPVCGNNVKYMGWTYYNCYNLTGSPVCGDNVTTMRSVYGSCYNLTGSPVCGPNVTDMTETYKDCVNLTGSPVCENKVTNMSYAYYNCQNLTGQPACGDKVTNMSIAYSNCQNLTGSPACGPIVTDMSYTYYNCRSLTGNPVCGDKVTNMESTYCSCENLTGSPVIGPNVTTMGQAYRGCGNLTGNPVCGNKVTNMFDAYSNCYNLTGSPVCGDNVVNMANTYGGCRNLTGGPVCGNNVANMRQAYINCSNLTGPTIIGPNVTDMGLVCYNCKNIRGHVLIYSNKITSAGNSFYNRSNSQMLNIYVPTTGSTLASCINTSSTITTGSNGSVSWTNDMSVNGCYYNTYYNIYIYPTDVEAKYFDIMYKHIAVMYSTTNTASRPVSYTLSGGDNAVYAEITGNKVNICKNDANAILTGINFKDDQSITSIDYLPSSIINMSNCFNNCINLTGKILSGPNVTDMYYAYGNCFNLTGSPVCGPNVTNFSHAYHHCYNMIGDPVCGDKVTDMSWAYWACSNLTGRAVCGNNVTNMYCAYEGCYKLSGSAVIGPNVTNASYAYANCYNLSSKAIVYSNQVYDMRGCFSNRNTATRLDVYLPAEGATLQNSLYNDYRSIVGTDIEWTNDVTTNGCYYNTAFNIYLYPSDMANFTASSWSVVNHSGVSYGFYYDTTNDFWVSGNKGINSSAALCNVTIENPADRNVIFEYICNGESNYDYGLFSNVNKTLSTSYSADTTNVFYNCKGQSSTSLKTLNYGPVSGTIQVKYLKDSSQHTGYDTLQFRVKFE